MSNRSKLLIACYFTLLAQLSLPAKAAATGQATGAESYCESSPSPFDQDAEKLELDMRYPKGQQSMLGEGMVLLGFTVNTAGAVNDIWLIDIIGAPIFAHAAAGSLAKAKYTPAIRSGSPVVAQREIQFQYQIEGQNRAGVHALVGANYDRAQAFRANGDFKRSVEKLKESLKLTLNLYEYALASYGLTVSYIGLNDHRRALFHARHAATSNAQFTDKGQRRSTFAMLSELEARDNNFRASLCAYERLKKLYPDYQPSAHLQDLLALSARELSATTHVRSNVELVETEREDLPTMWKHPMLRRTFQFSNVEGNLANYRLVCPALKSVEKFPISRTVDVDPTAGQCTIYVFGDAGAKFAFDEK